MGSQEWRVSPTSYSLTQLMLMTNHHSPRLSPLERPSPFGRAKASEDAEANEVHLDRVAEAEDVRKHG